MDIKTVVSKVPATAKKWIAIVLCALLALGVAFTAGRFSAPAKEHTITVETKVVDQSKIDEAVSKAQEEWKKNEHIKTVTVIVYKDGKPAEKTTTQTVDTTSSGEASVDAEHIVSTVTHEETTKKKDETITYKQPSYMLSLGAGYDWGHPTVPDLNSIKWSVDGQMRLIGGLWLGAEIVPQMKYGALKASFMW